MSSTNLSTHASTNSLKMTSLVNSPTTIKQLIAAYRSGELSPQQFLQEKLTQARSDENNAWISCLSDTQLDQYIERLHHSEIDDLPLYGVPFAIKDNIDLADLPTTAGCEAYRYHPASSAFVVATTDRCGCRTFGENQSGSVCNGSSRSAKPSGSDAK
ncbi:amidase family protein [Vibrio sp. PP-XX7]